MANTRRVKKRWSLYNRNRSARKKDKKKEQRMRKTPLGRGLFNETERVLVPPPIPTLSGRHRPLRPMIPEGRRVSPRTPRSPRTLLREARTTRLIGYKPLDNANTRSEIEQEAINLSNDPLYKQKYIDIRQSAVELKKLHEFTPPISKNPFSNDWIDIQPMKEWITANLVIKNQQALPSIYITDYIMVLIKTSSRRFIFKDLDEQISLYNRHKNKISEHLDFVINLVNEEKDAAMQDNYANITEHLHFVPIISRIGPPRMLRTNPNRQTYELPTREINTQAAIGVPINPAEIALAMPVTEVLTKNMPSFLAAVHIKILENQVEEMISELIKKS